MEETQESAVEYGKRIEMLYLFYTGRLVIAYVFIMSAWREYRNEGTWRAFSLSDGLATEEYIFGLGIVMKAKNIIDLGLLMKLFGGIFFIFNTYLGTLLLFIYQAILNPILPNLYNRDFVQLGKSYQRFRHTTKSVCDQNVFTRQKFYGKINKMVNKTLSANDGVAMVNEMFPHPDICDQMREIERIADSIPMFTQSKFKTYFTPLIQGVVVVGALLFFIAMERKHRMLKKRLVE